MTTITISKKITKEKDLVIIPRREYEEFLELKKIIPIVKPTHSELRAITKGRREMQKGHYITWQKLKHELAHSHNQDGRKTT